MSRRRLVLGFVLLLFGAQASSDTASSQESPTAIVVTSSSGEANGDTSSFEALQSNPGSDGISLPEAIAATNNDPGAYVITFTSGLAGQTIPVRYDFHTHEPLALTGGGVSISGDIDGNGLPDITVTSNLPAETPCDDQRQGGFVIASSANRLHALSVTGFKTAVVVRSDPGRTGVIYQNNEISNLTLNGCVGGISFGSPGQTCELDACTTDVRWINTIITGNTITAGFNGISVTPTGLGRDLIQGLTISNNAVDVARADQTTGGYGVGVDAESSVITEGNSISDVVITGNTVTGNPEGGIRVNSGGTASLVEQVRVTDNRIDIDTVVPPGIVPAGVLISAGDTEPRDGVYASENITRDVVVADNVLRRGQGVIVQSGCCGSSDNMVENVRIRRNRIRTEWPIGKGLGTIFLTGGHGSSFIEQNPPPVTGTRIYNVSIVANRIRIASPNLKAAVAVTGGGGAATLNEVSCVKVRRNTVIGTNRALLVRDNIGEASGNTARLGGC